MTLTLIVGANPVSPVLKGAGEDWNELERTMATINVRRLDEEVVRRLKRRAAENNRSLESEVRHILQCASEDKVSAKRKSFQELAARLRQRTKGRVQTPSERLIRNDRDSGHRV